MKTNPYLPKILVADDHQGFLEIVKEILLRKNVDVKTTPELSGLHLLLKSYQPDILFLDISFGEEDGRTICRDLKNNGYSSMPIILFSAHPMEPESVADAYADDFLEKPFSMQELSDMVDVYLTKLDRISA